MVERGELRWGREEGEMDGEEHLLTGVSWEGSEGPHVQLLDYGATMGGI